MLMKSSNQQRGVGLIEVLTSLLILSFGILGVVAMQSRAVQFNQGALFESKATVLAADIADRIRANREMVSSYQIEFSDNPDFSGDCFGASANCTPANIASYDLTAWREEVAEKLPSGEGAISLISGAGGQPVVVITIQYVDDRIESASAFAQSNSSPPKQFTFRTAI